MHAHLVSVHFLFEILVKGSLDSFPCSYRIERTPGYTIDTATRTPPRMTFEADFLDSCRRVPSTTAVRTVFVVCVSLVFDSFGSKVRGRGCVILRVMYSPFIVWFVALPDHTGIPVQQYQVSRSCTVGARDVSCTACKIDFVKNT